MYIHDVIGSLRARNLELQRQIDVLRLDFNLLDKALARHEARIHDLGNVPRETEVNTDGDQPTLF